jgi:predicted DNA-binding transcriptional regulator YafY
MRADRLLAILLHLQAHGKATARELAERLEVSERTVQRDMEALCASGIPLHAERGSRGGWVLPESYRSRLTGLTTGEIRALTMLQTSSVVRDLTLGADAAGALAKLLAALPADKRAEAEFARRHLHIDGAGWHGERTQSPWLQTVQQAVWEGRALRIRYASVRQAPGEEAPWREVRPWGLVAKRQTWYFAAEVEGEEELRTYRVSRLLAAELAGARFEVPADFDLAAWWERSTRSFREALPQFLAVVRLRESAWERFGKEIYARVQSIRASAGGWIEAEVDFQTLESARDLLLGYGGSAEALAPEPLRAAMRQAAEDILLLYGPSRLA